MLIFLMLVNHFKHLIVYNFHQKGVKQRPILKYIFYDVLVKFGKYSRIFLHHA